MTLPSRLPAAARLAAQARWPQGRLVRVGKAWAIVGRLDEGDEVRGWFSILVAGYDDEPDGSGSVRLWWTAASWGHKRRRDALAAAHAAEQDCRPH